MTGKNQKYLEQALQDRFNSLLLGVQRFLSLNRINLNRDYTKTIKNIKNIHDFESAQSDLRATMNSRMGRILPKEAGQNLLERAAFFYQWFECNLNVHNTCQGVELKSKGLTYLTEAQVTEWIRTLYPEAEQPQWYIQLPAEEKLILERQVMSELAKITLIDPDSLNEFWMAVEKRLNRINPALIKTINEKKISLNNKFRMSEGHRLMDMLGSVTDFLGADAVAINQAIIQSCSDEMEPEQINSFQHPKQRKILREVASQSFAWQPSGYAHFPGLSHAFVHSVELNKKNNLVVSYVQAANLLPQHVSDYHEAYRLAYQNIIQLIESELDRQGLSDMIKLQGVLYMPVLIQSHLNVMNPDFSKEGNAEKWMRWAFMVIKNTVEKNGYIQLKYRGETIMAHPYFYWTNYPLDPIRELCVNDDIHTDLFYQFALSTLERRTVRGQLNAENRLHYEAMKAYQSATVRLDEYQAHTTYPIIGRFVKLVRMSFNKNKTLDYNLHLSALERIIMSCSNGIVLESVGDNISRNMVSQMYYDALMIYYQEHEKFPDIEQSKQRASFTKAIAQVAKSAHAVNINAANQPGQNSIPDFSALMPNDYAAAIRQQMRKNDPTAWAQHQMICKLSNKQSHWAWDEWVNWLHFLLPFDIMMMAAHVYDSAVAPGRIKSQPTLGTLNQPASRFDPNADLGAKP